MNIELLLENIGGPVQIAKGVHGRFKLFIASLADRQNGNAFGILHGFEFSWHILESSAFWMDGTRPVDFKWHQYLRVTEASHESYFGERFHSTRPPQ
jgi:hypothetical protein